MAKPARLTSAFRCLSRREPVASVKGQTCPRGPSQAWVEVQAPNRIAPHPVARGSAGFCFRVSLVNTLVDRPWSQYFCCMAIGNRDFVARNPVATKRAMRALLKAADLCSAEPERTRAHARRARLLQGLLQLGASAARHSVQALARVRLGGQFALLRTASARSRHAEDRTAETAGAGYRLAVCRPASQGAQNLSRAPSDDSSRTAAGSYPSRLLWAVHAFEQGGQLQPAVQGFEDKRFVFAHVE